jgi:hypothetical protein
MHLSGGEANFCCNPSAIFWDVRFATLVQKQHGMLEYFLVTFRKVLYLFSMYSKWDVVAYCENEWLIAGLQVGGSFSAVAAHSGMWWLIIGFCGSAQ